MNEEFDLEAFSEEQFLPEAEYQDELPRRRRMPSRGFVPRQRRGAFTAAIVRRRDRKPRPPRPRPGFPFRFPNPSGSAPPPPMGDEPDTGTFDPDMPPDPSASVPGPDNVEDGPASVPGRGQDGPSNSADDSSEFYLEFASDAPSSSSTTAFMPRAVENPGGGRIKNKRPPNRAEVVNVRGVGRGQVPLHRLAATALEALINAARAEGLPEPLLRPVSGFRDPARQAQLWQRALARYGSPQEARKWVAPPGGSAHQTGRAIDFHLGGQNSSARVAQLRTLPAYHWLVRNARRFGFYPYEREPWHWEYNPPAAGAQEFSQGFHGASAFEGEFEDREVDTIGPLPTVNTPLPESGPGFRAYQRNQARRYGRPETIRALQVIAAAWQRAHPQGPRITVGDISFQGGGPMPPHKSHNRGVDVDLRLIRNDGREGGTTYRSPTYSRALTQELVNLIRANGVIAVQYIFFNDPAVTGVTNQAGHDNHLHVRFCALGDARCRPRMQRESSWSGETLAAGVVSGQSVAGSSACLETGKRAKALIERGRRGRSFIRRHLRQNGVLIRTNRIHAALDVPAPIGTPLYAVLDGRVIYSGLIPGFGNLVILHHARPPHTIVAGSVPVTTAYAHLQEPAVQRGDCVRAGQRIGLSGNTFRDAAGVSSLGDRTSLEPHLHFSVQLLRADRNRPRYLDPGARYPESRELHDIRFDHAGDDFNSHYEEDWRRRVNPVDWLRALGVRIATVPYPAPPASRARRQQPVQRTAQPRTPSPEFEFPQAEFGLKAEFDRWQSALNRGGANESRCSCSQASPG